MLREARGEDRQAVYDLLCQLEERALPWEAFSSIYLAQLTKNGHRFLVYEEAGAVVGVLHLRLEDQLHHAGPVAEILELAVDSRRRGAGIGRALLAWACRLAREAGCMQIEAASSVRRTGAHRFYLREGMVKDHFKFVKALDGSAGGPKQVP